MNVPFWLWLATVVGLVTLLAADLLVVGRGEHDVSLREAAVAVTFYVLLALGFGVVIFTVFGARLAGEFFAGWLTEYSLSVDNLFVFVIIMASFAVPRANQRNVLLVGIVLALALRGIFIALGAQVIARFDWVFYVFGGFLVYTAAKLAFGKHDDALRENAVLRLARRVLPTTDTYHGTRVVVRLGGRLVVTPMLIVMVAIGSTDLLFALDSIPAIFGLTKEPYLVFTANAFALLGLRQLYFLIGGLLDRLIYLRLGLSMILGFIGAKLILEALHGSGIGWAPTFPVWVSLPVIVMILVGSTVASLVSRQGRGSAASPSSGAVSASGSPRPAARGAGRSTQ